MNLIYCSKVRIIYCMYILILSGTAMPATEEAPVEVKDVEEVTEGTLFNVQI